MPVYMSSLGDAIASAAQHVVALNGRCPRCEVEGPCIVQAGALRVLAERGQLPRRLPGATRPQLVGARRIGHRGYR